MGSVRNKKHLVSFVFLLMMSLLLAACGGGKPSEQVPVSGSSEGSNAGSDAASGKEVTLDFSHFFPPSHEMETVIVQGFVKEVEEATGGNVKITSYPGASLAAPDGQFDAAATGAVDIAMSVNSYTPNQFPMTSVMELSFLSKTGEQGSKMLWQLYEEFPEFEAEYAGTVPLWLSTSDPGQIFTVGKPVKSYEDLKGMRIRSPSAETNEWLTALGATPVSMSMNETYEALEKGVVDGTIAPWEAIEGYSLVDVIDYATVGNFYMTTFFVTMNENSWNELGEENQAAIKELVGEKMAAKAGTNFDEVGQRAIEKAKEKGVEIYELSDDEMAEWSTFINPTVEKWIKKMEDKGLPGQAVYDRAVELGAQ
ncbi:extracellular solute-binding protein, family 7 [Bacillus sp. OxB-1]|uniref:TRAP transporter substrate-binding protein n=1 Tax=Bacillus sp. (strain OxB-1) TaxID=98228 RepID=UPI000581D828|nr:TRAP transporter substrate-binding protein [Bacillus sp. OxB-1]BAQ11918.1 extracellular solute-binding protein, family 7 [Bacillus sp. OxB-1]